MTPLELALLHVKMRELERLDDMMEKLARTPEDKLDELGEKVISVFGRNALDKRTDWVGKVTFVAVFNALREQRERVRDEVKDYVDVSECVHKVQTVQETTE